MNSGPSGNPPGISATVAANAAPVPLRRPARPGSVLDRFAGRLLDLAGDPELDVHVVVVVRSNEYTKLASVPALTGAVTSSQLVVGPPTDDEIRRIVIEPARRTGVAVEPALVELVAHDVGGYDTALPLVSAALAEVWDHRDGSTLCAERYTEIGGLATAGGLVFGGTLEGVVFALDARTGQRLWHFMGNDRVYSSPISFLANGKQLVSLPVGDVLITFGLD